MANFLAGLILGGGAVFVLGTVALRCFSRPVEGVMLPAAEVEGEH